MYTVVPIVSRLGDFERFLTMLRGIDEPKKVTVSFLETLGYKSKPHRVFVEVMRVLGFIDDLGVPTSLYRDLMVQDLEARSRIGVSLAQLYAAVLKHEVSPDSLTADDFVAAYGFSRSKGQLALETSRIVWSYGELPVRHKKTSTMSNDTEVQVTLDNGVTVIFPHHLTDILAKGYFAAGLHLLERVTD